jgi:hypothetical protein
VPATQSSRIRLNLNRQWKFLLGDNPAAREASFDDGGWQEVGLPHTFDLPYFRSADFYVGAGWYRKRIHVPEDWASQRVFLEFEGAFQVAEIFVNGRNAGRHEGGYTGFSIDITESVRAGENVLAIRVDNEWNPQLPPRAGEHIFSGGIYRDVYLVAKTALHIPWNGVCITTPQVSKERGTVHVNTEIANQTSQPRTCTLVTSIFDPSERHVASATTSQSIAPLTTIDIGQSFDPIAKPSLWHPDHPALYTVRQQVHDDQPADETEIQFGFRWFEWTADRGFFLNGEHLYLRGANAHQDHAGWGIAITQAACYRDAKLLKDAGFNFVRGAHYPHHPAFADACDRLGLIFWSEACFWGKGGFGPEGYWNASAYPPNPEDQKPFEANCMKMLGEMIRINRNHPSIVVWSMTNEAFFTYELDLARKLMADMIALSRKLDPTRLAAIGGAQRGAVDKLGDVAGYNGDGARLFIDPGIPNMVSEYGAISKPVDADDPFFGDLQPERFDWRGGEAIWCGFDYGSIAGRQGLKGILQHNRLPKRSWYWYRNALRAVPPPPCPVNGVPVKLDIFSDKSTIDGTDAMDDCQIIVSVLDQVGTLLSNCPPITLTIESGPGEFPTGRTITFDAETDVSIAMGQAAVAFRSYHGGESVIRASSPGLVDATCIITTRGEPRFVAGETAIVGSRAYRPPRPSQAAINAAKNLANVARDRPCRASSEAESHPARLANDADAATFWQAADDSPRAWFQVDLEGFYQLSGCRVIFARPGNYRFVVEVSRNATDWSLAIDRNQTVRTDPIRNDVFDPGTIARYVRLTFTAIPPGAVANLAELEIHGLISVC